MNQTYFIQTLGCKVNQYESEQIATLLRNRGFVAATSPEQADLQIINTCSVTTQAASKSRQTVRRATRLPIYGDRTSTVTAIEPAGKRVVVTGCWATSNRSEAEGLTGVDAVLSHHQDVATGLNQLLDQWSGTATTPIAAAPSNRIGTRSLPLLGERHTGHQRAMLKVQDGCDAHCTYCIIPTLRPSLWSKPIDDAVREARQLVDSGHKEIVLTGIFLGAYGKRTALRRRQNQFADETTIAMLLESLCTKVHGLKRLRFSSLEPGDLTPQLISRMREHKQVVPHFHLPLQSGSDALLHRMNRQYTRDDFLKMVDEVHAAFDRPAITTDIIVGFPGETEDEFQRTVEVVQHAKFIHIHAFSFSPRPGTAAARWKKDFIHGPVVNERIEQLTTLAAEHSVEFRRQFVGEEVEVLVEQTKPFDTLRHGRCERYFDIHFEDATAAAGDAVKVLIERVANQRTHGRRV